METIRVNMTPCEDIKTINASQNDNEAREWGFELHNNGEKIDSSSISDQLVFKAYEGGTEQILPENTSTPTTSPFKGDIRYPQGLLSDQEFLYRESPTEEDGLAKITDIKGNTLVWNQLVQNGNFESTSGWFPNIEANTISVGSNELTVNINTLSANAGVYGGRLPSRIANHKYYFKLDVYVPHATTVRFGNDNELQSNVSVGWNTVGGFIQNTKTSTLNVCYITATESQGFSSGETFKIRNYQCFDFTQMGLDITDPSDFTSLFSLPYYDFNRGTLLSFNGTGIKTTGKNLIKPDPRSDTTGGVTYTFNEDGSLIAIGTSTATANQFVLISGKIKNIVRGAYYFLSGGDDKIRLRITTFDSSGNIVRRSNTSSTSGNLRFMFNDEEVEFYVSAYAISTGVNINSTLYPQLELSYEKTSFEPYIESVLNLPISQYFPTGMKSAGSVYDELTETKARTRIGSLKGSDIQGTVSSAVSTGGFHYVEVNGLGSKANGQGISNMLPIKNEDAWSSTVPCVQIRPTTEGSIRIYGAFTTFQEFQTQYASLVIYYELATPIETSITTASLVTENAEIPLSNEDGVLIGKCTEQLSSESGFFDAKIKLTDADGECYSNKIQLHVERKPS